MAAKPIKKAIDLLLLTVDRGDFDYISIPQNYRSDDGAAKKIVTDLIQRLTKIVNAGARDYVHGVYYVTTLAAPLVAVPYFEVEDATPEILTDAQLWFNDIAAEEAAKIPNSKLGNSGRRKGYTGIQISWTS